MTSVYEEVRTLLPRDEVLTAPGRGAGETLAAALGDAEVEPLADALLDAVRPLDGCPRQLFSVRGGVEQLTEWAEPLSARIVEWQCFPTDPRKRAAA